jgi:hypothetical protein
MLGLLRVIAKPSSSFDKPAFRAAARRTVSNAAAANKQFAVTNLFNVEDWVCVVSAAWLLVHAKPHPNHFRSLVVPLALVS